MKIRHLQRRPMGAQVSIERLFAEVRAALPAGMEAEAWLAPCPSRGFLPRLRNLFAARRLAGDGSIHHITGDVHYLAMGLPSQRLVLTIHDCGVLHRLKGWRREMVRRLWFEWPVRRAAVVTTISRTTRDDLCRWVSPALHGKIRVIPNCVGEAFEASAKEWSRACPVFLQVGTGWNKNLERAVGALRGLRCRLEIVGPVDEARRQRLLGSGVDCKFLGRLSDGDLVAAYRRCDALIFASEFEGFGLPILEAQATGRPVITSAVSAMPEAAGAGALLVNPAEESAIRDAVLRLMEDAALRQDLIALGHANVARFRAAAVAAEYAAVYEELDRASACR